MVTHILIAILLLCVSPIASAADAIPTPKRVTKPEPSIRSTPPSQSDNNCGGAGNLKDVQCLSRLNRALDAEMNIVYTKALSKLLQHPAQDDRGGQEQLRKSQRAWLKYTTENCRLIGGLEGGSSLWVTHYSAICTERELRERIKFLKDIASADNEP